MLREAHRTSRNTNVFLFDTAVNQICTFKYKIKYIFAGRKFRGYKIYGCHNNVLMYYFDTRQHHRSHIHIKYQGQEVVLSIPEGEILAGKLKTNKMKLVQAWIEIHQEELMADWKLASNGESIFKIAPLK